MTWYTHPAAISGLSFLGATITVIGVMSIHSYLKERKAKQAAKPTLEITPELEQDTRRELMKEYIQRERERIKKGDKPFVEQNIYDMFKRGRKKRQWLYLKNLSLLKDIWHFKRNATTQWLINMELKNGLHTSFNIVDKKGKGTFIYNGGEYILDNDSKYYHLSGKMYALDFHEDFCMPIKRKFPVDKLKEGMAVAPDFKDIVANINPVTLRGTIKAHSMEQLNNIAVADEWYKQAKTLLILIVFGVGATLIYLLYSTGAFQGVTG